MILQIVGLIIAISLIVVIAFDVIPIVRDWASRIHMGRIEEHTTWNKVITKKGSSWLVNTPKMKVTDNTRLVVLDMFKGNYSNSALQSWQEAALLLGLSESLKCNDDPQVKEKILKYLNSKFDSTGHWKSKPENVDAAMLAYAVMKIDFIDSNKYKNAMDYTWGLIQNHVGQDDTVMYRKSMRKYRYVDTVGFICPFLIAYGLKYERKECIDLAIKQIKEYENHGLQGTHKIPSHAYEINYKIPLGLYGWGRGLGWFAIGLIDAWNELPEDHKYKLDLEQSVKQFAKAVIMFQQENGAWNWTVTRSECRSDSSATATLGWFLLNAAKINEISEQCIVGTQKALDFLMKVTKRNGEIDFSQGDTKDIGVYSTLFSIFPFTQGFSIRTVNYYNSFIAREKIINM